MDTLRQGTGTQKKEWGQGGFSVPMHWLRAPRLQKLLEMFLRWGKKKSSLEAMVIIELVATCC